MSEQKTKLTIVDCPEELRIKAKWHDLFESAKSLPEGKVIAYSDFFDNKARCAFQTYARARGFTAHCRRMADTTYIWLTRLTPNGKV